LTQNSYVNIIFHFQTLSCFICQVDSHIIYCIEMPLLIYQAGHYHVLLQMNFIYKK